MPKKPGAPQPPQVPTHLTEKKRRRSSSPTSEPLATRHLPKHQAAGPKGTAVYRRATLYDAVAGRLIATGFRDSFHNLKATSYWDDTRSTAQPPLSPREALFKNPRAPDLYEEVDSYNAHRWLVEMPNTNPSASKENKGGVGKLPDSDLLKALHAYASDFFAASTTNAGLYDWYTLDETALLALGMLIEEEVARILGQHGWAVFVDPEYGPKNIFPCRNPDGTNLWSSEDRDEPSEPTPKSNKKKSKRVSKSTKAASAEGSRNEALDP